MAIEILPLTKEDIPSAVACIQKAFADDPYFHWVFNDKSGSQLCHIKHTKPIDEQFNIHRNAASLAAHFLYGLSCNEPIFVAKYTANTPSDKIPTDSPVVGVCWWYSPQPPSEPVPWSVWAQDWILSFRQLYNNIRFGGRGGLNVRRYWLWKARQQETHERVWTDPRGYYFCNVIAVDSSMRGMGLGRKLVEVVSKQADREGMPCYLESSKGFPNLKIYEKLGFEMVSEIDCVDGKDRCKVYSNVYWRYSTRISRVERGTRAHSRLQLAGSDWSCFMKYPKSTNKIFSYTQINVLKDVYYHLPLAPVLSMIRGKSRFTKYIIAAFASYIVLTLLFSGTGERYWRKDWVRIARSTLEDRALEHIQNETLGFEHIYAIGLKERTDKRDFLNLAASIAGFRVEWMDGVHPEDMSEKALLNDNLLAPSEIGCWRAHMNALSNMVQNSYSTALVLEDDADWDVNIRQQLREFARGVRALTKNANTTKNAPYGTNWDILWVGGCASSASPNETQFYAIPNDPTAPSVDHRGTWGGPLDSWKEIYPETSTRFIYRADMGCCTYGYAVTRRGAERILAALAVDRLVAAVDNSMADMCGGKDGRSQIECYAPFPNIIGTYKAAGLASKDSDIREGSDDWHEAQAWNLMYSTRLNIHRLVAGRDTVYAQYDEGFPWSRRVLNWKEFEYPRGYLVS
ncbi:hypothetical protein ASPBRDRAFT_184132 [Aspergillus brasiliensis CBS 101740]|uniref:Uncharacterized protein n=2 Tax=Aspergillus brasiliensis TaxID=319629 RepID=A0A1L9UA81_ASPBC|nr:hypothetical protein ASPBRDRAFT_184132 [Aspergillus brasiliensis CBS 101740]